MSGNRTLWWTLLVGWIVGCVYWHVCEVRQLCDGPIGPTKTVDTVSVAKAIIDYPSLQIVDSAGLDLSAAGNFLFSRSGFEPDLRAVKNEVDSLARYLLNSPRQLTIFGAFLSDENNTSALSNLGIARAGEVKKVLVDAGVPDSSIQLNFLRDSMLISLPNSDSLSGGIYFAFAKASPETEDDLAKAEKYQSIFQPMDLYFPKASTVYIKTSENEKFLTEARTYLSAHAEKRLYLIGHTDDEDSAEWNLVLSRKRAEAVKRQLMASGITAARIVASGKGEAAPRASNLTTLGKMANRRVTIVVK